MYFDRNLKKLTDFGKEQLENPAALDVQGDSVFVLNNGSHQVEVFRWSDGKIGHIGKFSFCAGIGKDILVNGKFIYVSADREIRLFAKNGKFIKKFCATLLVDFHPAGLAIDEEKRVCISLKSNDNDKVQFPPLKEGNYNLIITIPEHHLMPNVYIPQLSIRNDQTGETYERIWPKYSFQIVTDGKALERGLVAVQEQWELKSLN